MLRSYYTLLNKKAAHMCLGAADLAMGCAVPYFMYTWCVVGVALMF